MHVLAPGASMDSSAGLRDSDRHAIRDAHLYDRLRRSGCSTSDTLITPLPKSQAVSHLGRGQLGSHDTSGYLPTRQDAYNTLNGHSPTASVLCALSLASVGAGVGMKWGGGLYGRPLSPDGLRLFNRITGQHRAYLSPRQGTPSGGWVSIKAHPTHPHHPRPYGQGSLIRYDLVTLAHFQCFVRCIR